MMEPHLILFALSVICLIPLGFFAPQLCKNPSEDLMCGTTLLLIALAVCLILGFVAYSYDIPYSKTKEDLAIQLVDKGCKYKSHYQFSQQKHTVYIQGPEDEEVLLTGYFPNLDKHVEQKELEVKMQKIKQILKD